MDSHSVFCDFEYAFKYQVQQNKKAIITNDQQKDNVFYNIHTCSGKTKQNKKKNGFSIIKADDLMDQLEVKN